MGKDEKSTALAVSNAQISGQIIFTRLKQQLKIQHGLKGLDTTRISRLGKSKVDSLDDLERRVTKMRHELKTLHVSTVAEDVSADLMISNSSHVDSQFTSCSRCERKILVRLFAAHDAACARLKSEDTIYQGSRPIPKVGEEVQQLINTFATFKPQPPRNCLVVAKGPSFIAWEWESPVFDGGLPVTDYEISYVAKLIEFDKIKGKFKRSTEVCSSLKTSQWCLSEPVCHKGYKMEGLHGGAEYTKLMIRCANVLGWSEWISMTALKEIDKKAIIRFEGDLQKEKEDEYPFLSVKTEEAVAPGIPMFFVCTQMSSSCVHLLWDAPFYNGGSPVIEYLVLYTVLERTISAVSRDIYVEKTNQLRVKVTDSISSSVVLRNLPDDSDVVAIRVKAVSRIGLIGESLALGIDVTKQDIVESPKGGKKARKIPKVKSADRVEITSDGSIKGVVCRTLISSRHR
jgi:hypothetical protein